ncbi:MAG TPA: BatD family protein [Chthoniobacter sp.]|nr:BatD family protein [Chthoniobacter sp.]
MKRLIGSLCRLACLLVFGVAGGLAQEPKVRTSLEKQGDLWVGQRVIVVVELLAPGFFSGSPTLTLPSPSGLLLVPPSGSPTLSTETIDGTSYTVQRHEVSAFPRKAGDLTIPSFSVRFQFKRQPLDKEPVSAVVKTDPLALTVKAPPGAERLGNLISARDLKVEETWAPKPGHAKAGDAFTRTITYSAPDVPAMAFPPFPAGKIDGLRVYPKPPEVLDESERGALSGKRRDTFTYVCQRPGRFIIPAARLTWFDLDAQKLQIIDFPAEIFEVAPNPAMAAATPAAQVAPPVTYTAGFWCGLAGVILLLAGLLAPDRMWLRLLAPFRPVHLAPLNPSAPIRDRSVS